MRTVAIVGTGGVGAAHLCAAVRCGLQVKFIVDIDPRVLGRLRSSWSNRWLDVSEEVEPQGGCLYLRDLRTVLAQDVDLCIVAVPPLSQEVAVQGAAISFPNAAMLVEKPIVLGRYLRDRLGDRLRMSAEWIYTAGIEKIGEPAALGMTYPWTPKASGWTISAFDDFMPHLASIVVKRYGHDGDVRWDGFSGGHDSFALRLHYGGRRLSFYGNRFAPPKNYGLHVAPQDEPGETFAWQDDLFECQLRAEKPGLGIEEVEAVLSIMRIRT